MKLEAIIARITYLREKNNAIILAHNYQLPEVQDISDLLGDSLDLSMKAKKTNADNIIFCGVDFMAESAKILNPEKNVIIPDIDARCPMANMVDLKDLEKLKNKNPDAKVVAYINTTSDVKAISDVCCTSSNGVKVVKSLKSEKVIFVPDKNLGSYIQRFVPEKQMILWPGMCTTHHRISKQDIFKLKKEHPESEVLVHPECRPEIINIADHVFSTNGMVNYAKNSDVKEFIIGTEKELCYRLKNENPNKMFYPIKSAICPNMKKITLEKVLNSLETLEPKIHLSEDIMERAKNPLQKMMEIGRGD
ncbi:MAG: quinolinate synthase [Thermoplasmata archaeon M8B2D]|nr:MAG: quinolinate synthase [Thermoplasmata archaeon M8B2D]